MLSYDEEQQLVREAKASLQAFSKLYQYYLPRIYAYTLNRTGDPKVAEDLTSETFFKAMKGLNSFQMREYRFGSWLYKIAHNTIIDYQKKKREIIAEKLEAPSNESPSKELEIQEANYEIRTVMQKLKKDYQEILALKFFEDLNNTEIAEIIGCNLNTLHVKIHRSLEAFRKKYLVLYPQKEVTLEL